MFSDAVTTKPRAPLGLPSQPLNRSSLHIKQTGLEAVYREALLRVNTAAMSICRDCETGHRRYWAAPFHLCSQVKVLINTFR